MEVFWIGVKWLKIAATLLFKLDPIGPCSALSNELKRLKHCQLSNFGGWKQIWHFDLTLKIYYACTGGWALVRQSQNLRYEYIDVYSVTVDTINTVKRAWTISFYLKLWPLQPLELIVYNISIWSTKWILLNKECDSTFGVLYLRSKYPHLIKYLFSKYSKFSNISTVGLAV